MIVTIKTLIVIAQCLKNIIKFYGANNLDGSYKTESSLSEEAIKNTIGMKVRCSLKNGDIVIGFSEPYRSKSKDFDGTVHDYINVWTWKHSDELAKNTKNPHKYDQIFKRVYIL